MVLGYQLTCLVGMVPFEYLLGRLIIVDFPSKADDFLSPEEKELAMRPHKSRPWRRGGGQGGSENGSYHLNDWKLSGWTFNRMLRLS
ncbi:unnamed protein product, partial [Clonostachys chloroleuca]